MPNIAYASLLLLIFTVPWENSFQIASIGTGSRLVGLVMLPLCLIAIVRNGRVSFPWAIVLLAAFVVFVALSLSWTLEIEGGLTLTLTYVQLLLLTWVVTQMIDSETKLHGVFLAYVVGGYVASWAAIRGYMTGAFEAYMRFAVEGMDPNDMALRLAVALAMAGYLVVCQRGWWRLVALGFIPLGIYGILLAASRTGFLAMLIAGSLPILLMLRPRHYTKAIALGLAGLVVGSVLLARYVPERSWDRISAIESEVTEGNLSGRVGIWSAGLEVINEAPILGSGVAGYGKTMQRLVGWKRALHNGFLSITAQFGVVGLLMVCAAWTLVLRDVLSMPVQERRVWFVLLVVLLMAVMSINWELKKTTWLLFAMALAHAQCLRSRPRWAMVSDDLAPVTAGQSVRAVHRG